MTQFYNLQQIHSRRAAQVALGFSMPRAYTEATDQQIADNANGVGPDSCPSAVRVVLTLLEPYLDLAADIHDVEFRLSDSQRPGFLAANARIYHNGRLWIMANRGRLNPRRYIELWRLARDRDILDGSAGWSAWVSAFERYHGASL